MTDFKKRERGEEAKFAMSEDILFKTNARRNKLLGLWAAGLLKLSDEDSLNYALELLKLGAEKDGDGRVFKKIRADFDANNVEQSDHQIHRTVEEFQAKALRKIEDS